MNINELALTDDNLAQGLHIVLQFCQVQLKTKLVGFIMMVPSYLEQCAVKIGSVLVERGGGWGLGTSCCEHVGSWGWL